MESCRFPGKGQEDDPSDESDTENPFIFGRAAGDNWNGSFERA